MVVSSFISRLGMKGFKTSVIFSKFPAERLEAVNVVDGGTRWLTEWEDMAVHPPSSESAAADYRHRQMFLTLSPARRGNRGTRNRGRAGH